MLPNQKYQSLAFGLLMSVAALGCGASGGAPVVQDIPAQVAAVNQELMIVIEASDPDGDQLAYSFDSNIEDLSRDQLTTTTFGIGTFRWTPQAKHIGVHAIDFIVSDGSNQERVTVQIDVRSAIGANASPAFQEPLGQGTTIDLNNARCITLNVVIRDSDSVDVLIEEAEPKIEGAEFDQTSGLTGRWEWCPSDEQMAASDRYTLLLSADDGENPKASLRYLLVLRRPTKANCPGETPVVNHTAQNHVGTSNVQVQAEVSDAEGLRNAPLIYFSTSDPGDPANLGSMVLAGSMVNTGGDNWQLPIPNPVADQPSGTSSDLYYVILARDDDDAEGNCDHEVLSETFQITVENDGSPGNEGNCEPCIADIQCGSGASDLCVRVGADGDGYCLSSCTTGSCPSGYTCSPGDLTSIEGNSGRQCVPDTNSCEPIDLTCDDDGFEQNDTRLQAESKPPLAEGSIDAQSCPISAEDDDEDWYQFVVGSEGTVSFTMTGGNGTDLDLGIYDATGTFMGSSITIGSSNESFSECMEAGTYYVRVLGYPGPSGTLVPQEYSLDYSVATGSCNAAVCEADEFEPNNLPLDATQTTTILENSWVGETLTACTDDDWYTLRVFDDEIIDILAVFSHAGGDIDMELYAEDRTTLLEFAESVDDDETLTWDVGTAGCSSGCDYYLVVYAYQSEGNFYDLAIDVDF